MVFNLGHSIAGLVERLPAAVGGEDQLGPPIGRIGPSLEVAQSLQITDEFGGGRQTQLRPGRQVRQPDAVDTHVAEDVQMRFTQVGISVFARWRKQFGPELPKQSAQELTDGMSVGRQIS